MKYHIIFLVCLLLSLNSIGQLEKRNWLIGGSGNLFSFNEKYTYPTFSGTSKYTDIELSASIGYFLFDKFSIGLRPYFSNFKGSSSGGGSTNNLKLAVGPFARYYFLKDDRQFNLLGDVSCQFGTNQELNGEHPKGKFNSFSVMTGIEAFFNSSVGLEILVGYKQQVASYDNSPSAYIDNRKGFQTSIGFQFHLQKEN